MVSFLHSFNLLFILRFAVRCRVEDGGAAAAARSYEGKERISLVAVAAEVIHHQGDKWFSDDTLSSRRSIHFLPRSYAPSLLQQLYTRLISYAAPYTSASFFLPLFFFAMPRVILLLLASLQLRFDPIQQPSTSFFELLFKFA